MALAHTTATRNALANAIATLVDAGAAPVIEIYDAGLLLAEVAMATPAAFAAASSGEIDAVMPLADSSANAAGTADNFIVYDDPSGGGGTEVFRGSVSDTGGGGDLEMSNATFAAGETINITTFTWIAPV